MKLYQCFLTENDCYRANGKIKPAGIMVHSTGANNPTLRRYVQPDDGLLGKNVYGNDWNRPDVGACVHAFIGKLADGSVAAYQTLPWTMRGWHAGGAANNTHISFEICEDDLTDAAYFAAVYREAVSLCAYLCEQYGLDPLKDGVLIDHAEGYRRGIASNHGDVGNWFPKHGKSMDTLRTDVRKMLDGEVDELRYVTLREVPEWYRPTLDMLIAEGLLSGKGGSGESLIIDLSEDSCRILTILDRAGAFDGGK